MLEESKHCPQRKTSLSACGSAFKTIIAKGVKKNLVGTFIFVFTLAAYEYNKGATMRYSLKILPAAISEAYGIKYRLTALNDDGSESWRLSVKEFEELQGFVPGEVFEELQPKEEV